MICKVHDLVGKWALTYEQGQQVYDLIQPELAQGRPVTLDFDGVKSVGALFWNRAVGDLLEDFTPDGLKRLLQVANIYPGGERDFETVIDMSHQYYTNPRIREAVDRMMRSWAEEE